jgi:hypothetical protein
MVAVIAPSSTPGLANYFTYINGQLYNSLVNAYYPPAVPRQNAWLGRSGWDDPYMVVELDTFNVYNSTLSPEQVTALFTRAFPQGADTAPAAGGAAEDFTVPGGVQCSGYGSSTQPVSCEPGECGSVTAVLSLVQVRLPPSVVVNVTHLGLFQISNTYGNSGEFTFRLGLYYLNSSGLQLLVQTDSVQVTDPGISTPYVIAALEQQQQYTVPDWAVDNLWVANWFQGGRGSLDLSLLSGYTSGLNIYEKIGYNANGLPTSINAFGSFSSQLEAMDVLSCDSTASLLVA